MLQDLYKKTILPQSCSNSVTETMTEDYSALRFSTVTCNIIQDKHMQGKSPDPRTLIHYSYLFNILANKIGFNCMVGKIARCVVY